MTDKKKTAISVSETALVAKGNPDKAPQSGTSVLATKRSFETSSEPPADKNWDIYFRRVFAARGVGKFKEKVPTANGDRIDSFGITGAFCDGEVMTIQVWGDHAKEFADLFA